jgi:CBS domain-containing protein
MNENVTVREVMEREFVGVSESDGMLETAELLVREEADLAVVLHGSEPVGVVTDRDVLAHLVDGGDPTTATVEDVMTTSVPTVSAEETLPEARDRMTSWSTGWLVVSDGGEPDGVVTEHDILATSTLGTEATATNPVATDQEMREQVTATSATATENQSAATDTFDDQGICEQCGSLASELASFNGQLLCADCRDI